MSTEKEAINDSKIPKEDFKTSKPIRVAKKGHRKSNSSKYTDLKVYSTSNKSSKERLQKIIKESKENASIFIDCT